MIAPIRKPYRVSLKWHATTSPYSPSNPHNGTDLVPADTTPEPSDWDLIAPEAGTVTSYGNTGGKSGWMMVLQGASGKRHSFSHTVARSNVVKVGTKVKAGQKLAVIGSTGFVSGRHVHWVVNSGSVNPMSLVKEVKMITLGQQQVLYRLYLGREPGATGLKNVGKKTFESERRRLKASASYKTKIAQAKANTINCKAHLPKELRV